MATTQFELVTPTRTLYSGQAEMIVCRTVEGEIAFLANHMPYIGALDIGVVRIVGPGGEGEGTGASRRSGWPSRGGFVEVKDNQVIMLADAAQVAARSTWLRPVGTSRRPRPRWHHTPATRQTSRRKPPCAGPRSAWRPPRPGLIRGRQTDRARPGRARCRR